MIWVAMGLTIIGMALVTVGLVITKPDWLMRQLKDNLANSEMNSMNSQRPSQGIPATNQTVPIRMEFLETLILRSLGLESQTPNQAGNLPPIQPETNDNQQLSWLDNPAASSPALQEVLEREAESTQTLIMSYQKRLQEMQATPNSTTEAEYDDLQVETWLNPKPSGEGLGPIPFDPQEADPQPNQPPDFNLM